MGFKARVALRPEAFPFRAKYTSAQIREANRDSSWMSLLCASVAELCGIDAKPYTPSSWHGENLRGSMELCAKLHSVRVLKLARQPPQHRIMMELAAFNSKGVRVAWHEGPVPIFFTDGRNGTLLNDDSKRALTALVKTGRAPTLTESEGKEVAIRATVPARRPRRRARRSAPTAMRPSFEAQFAELAKRGAHFEVLRYGAPARKASLDKVERNVLGGPLDPNLRSFFEEMDGLQCCYWIDPCSKKFSRDVPKPASKEALSWEESTNAFSPLWERIKGVEEAWVEADCPVREDGEQFLVGLINIPDHKTMFTSKWDDMLGLEPGEYLFDAHHHYNGEYLEYYFDPDAKEQTSLVVSASDSFAARYDRKGITVAKYLESLVRGAGRIEV